MSPQESRGDPSESEWDSTDAVRRCFFSFLVITSVQAQGKPSRRRPRRPTFSESSPSGVRCREERMICSKPTCVQTPSGELTESRRRTCQHFVVLPELGNNSSLTHGFITSRQKRTPPEFLCVSWTFALCLCRNEFRFFSTVCLHTQVRRMRIRLNNADVCQDLKFQMSAPPLVLTTPDLLHLPHATRRFF